MASMRSGAVAFAALIRHFSAHQRGAHPNPAAPISFSGLNYSMPAGCLPWGQLRAGKQVMPSVSFSHREPAAGTGRARVSSGEIFVDAAARRETETGREPLWGQFLRTWESLASAKGRYPSRTEIDPMALGAKLLPNVFLVDLVDTPGRPTPRFRFRLLGQAIVDREPTRPGDFLDQIGATADASAIEHHYNACLDGKVWIREASLAWADPRGDYLRYRVMMLPLSDDGATVSHLIGLALYEF
jgi:hypothetical protein